MWALFACIFVMYLFYLHLLLYNLLFYLIVFIGSVYEIVPPRDGKGNYTIDATNAFAPSAPAWTYGAPGQINGGPTQCGAFRTLDGTTLITLTSSARTFEVNNAGTVIWDRTNTGLTIARAPRYRMVNGVWVGP